MAAISASQAVTLGGPDLGTLLATDDAGQLWVAKYGSAGAGITGLEWSEVTIPFTVASFGAVGGRDRALVVAVDNTGGLWTGQAYSRDGATLAFDWNEETITFTAASASLLGGTEQGLAVAVDDLGRVWSSRYNRQREGALLLNLAWSQATLPEAA